MKATQYSDDPRFKDYYLEDSYVLSIDERADELSFKLDVVLTPGHPAYEVAKQGEQHCYRRATLVFRRLTAVNWKDRSDRRPAMDASGEKDYGNIDVFEILADDSYELRGDWGCVQITARQASMEIASSSAYEIASVIGKVVIEP